MSTINIYFKQVMIEIRFELSKVLVLILLLSNIDGIDEVANLSPILHQRQISSPYWLESGYIREPVDMILKSTIKSFGFVHDQTDER